MVPLSCTFYIDTLPAIIPFRMHARHVRKRF